MIKKLTQPQRLFIAIGEMVVLLVIHRIAFGTWLPQADVKGLWLYSAMLNVVLASRLISPFYEKPVDNIVYSVTALVVIWVAIKGQAVGAAAELTALISTIILGAAISSGLGAIAFLNSESGSWGEALRLISDRFGNARIAFSLVILVSVLAFHQNAPLEITAIAIAWAATVAFKPFENTIDLITKVRG